MSNRNHWLVCAVLAVAAGCGGYASRRFTPVVPAPATADEEPALKAAVEGHWYAETVGEVGGPPLANGTEPLLFAKATWQINRIDSQEGILDWKFGTDGSVLHCRWRRTGKNLLVECITDMVNDSPIWGFVQTFRLDVVESDRIVAFNYNHTLNVSFARKRS